MWTAEKYIQAFLPVTDVTGNTHDVFLLHRKLNYLRNIYNILIVKILIM